MKYQIDLHGWDRLDAQWRIAPSIVREELTAAMYESELLLQREVQELTPVGVGGAGGMKGSIHAQEPEVLANSVIGVVGSPLKYAESLELGTKPHWAPIEPLIDWVRNKLGISEKEAEAVARSVQFGIAAHGTPAVGMFHRGLNSSREQIARRFMLARDRIAARMASGAA